MKRTHWLLTAALVASVAGPAQAVTLNPQGLGQVLVYPYYTVNKGEDTLISLLNTDDAGKAVRMIFREGYNGRAVMEFLLLLAPHDVWTGTVSAVSAEGGAQVGTTDGSCVDGVTAWPLPFSSAGYTGSVAGPNGPSYTKDSGPQGIERTREGMIEVIALGDVKPGSATALAMRPGADGGKPSCKIPPSLPDDLATAGNGLAGSGAIINAAEGTYYAYNADALSGFAIAPLLNPISASPDLASARSTGSRFPGGAIATVFDGNGEPMRLDYARGIDAVSAVFMTNSILNEFLLAPGIGANTDWIVTFPTKQFYVDSLLYAAPQRPFSSPFRNGQAPDDAMAYKVYGSDGNNWWKALMPHGCGSPADASCPRPITSFPWQVNTLAFLNMRNLGSERSNTVSGVFGSRLAIPPYTYAYDHDDWFDPGSGTLTLEFSSQGLYGHDPEGRAVWLLGLPVSGFMAYNIINANAAPGKLANYGGTFRHRKTFACSYEDAGMDAPCT